MQDKFEKWPAPLRLLGILALIPAAQASCRGQAAGPSGPCPEEMAPIPGMEVCIDRFEASIHKKGEREFASSRRGVMPAATTSFNQAKEACANAGKRLCTLEEWDRACEGEEGRKYPYGNEFDAKACNAVYLYENPHDSAPKPSGSMPGCVTPEGVYDLSGNLWEWVDHKDASGILRLLRGGGYSNKDYLLHCRTKDNAFQPMDEHHDAHGFRCCKAITP